MHRADHIEHRHPHHDEDHCNDLDNGQCLAETLTPTIAMNAVPNPDHTA